jgi:hypothetical protein
MRSLLCKSFVYKKGQKGPSKPLPPQSGIRRASKTQVFGMKEQNWVRFAKNRKDYRLQVVFVSFITFGAKFCAAALLQGHCGPSTGLRGQGASTGNGLGGREHPRTSECAGNISPRMCAVRARPLSYFFVGVVRAGFLNLTPGPPRPFSSITSTPAACRAFRRARRNSGDDQPSSDPLDAFSERCLFNSVPLSNSQKTCGSHKPFVVARKLDACAVGADEFDGGQMNGIQRADGRRKRLKGAL